MGQYDSETDAALAQLNFEELAKTPGGEFAEIVGDLLSLAGVAGPWAVAGRASNLILKIRRLAGASYTSNLIYSITAVAHDLKPLREINEELRKRVDELPKNPQFAEAISALALRAMQTSAKDRLKRLARIVVNGVKEDDLEPESLDDMMRAAVELRNLDVAVLDFISLHQKKLLEGDESPIEGWPQPWIERVQVSWEKSLLKRGKIFASGRCSRGEWRSALARLQALGFITPVQSNPISTSGEEPYALLPSGQTFLERLSVIVTES